MKKRILGAALAFGILFTSNVQAAAVKVESVEAPNNTVSQDVTATFVDGDLADTVYSVDVEWGSMEFSYKGESQGVWNPDNHQYENKVEGAWSNAEGADLVTVTNHSNADVTVNLAYASEAGYEKVAGNFDLTDYNLLAGVENDYDNADSNTSTLSLAGDLASEATSVKVGTATVTISPNTGE